MSFTALFSEVVAAGEQQPAIRYSGQTFVLADFCLCAAREDPLAPGIAGRIDESGRITL